jgi:DNA-directed RNA polymerase subunit delta
MRDVLEQLDRLEDEHALRVVGIWASDEDDVVSDELEDEDDEDLDDEDDDEDDDDEDEDEEKEEE